MPRTVLHISADFHDGFDTLKPLVVGRLVDGLHDRARQLVISINRTSNPAAEALLQSDGVWALRYFAPPGGVLLSHFLARLAKRLLGLLQQAGVRPDVLVGHKFTLESVVCWHLSQTLRVPYVAGFQGTTDCKIFRFKRLDRALFARVARQAEALVFPTVWSQRFFEQRLLGPAGVAPERVHLIPFISGDMNPPARTQPTSVRRFVSICRLDAWRLKNLHRLIAAIGTLRHATGMDWTLDIVGTGTAAAQGQLDSMITRQGLGAAVRLLGGRSRAEIDALLPGYCAMVMPSHPESFGLVYLESLLQGVPIMCARGAGFDGFFSRGFPGVVVRHDHNAELVAGLQTLAERSDEFRLAIQRLGNDLDMFKRSNIESRYAELLGI
jgi:glycosyltransferase involved in cell wall biosynthesis